MKDKIKNFVLYLLFVILVGGVIGTILWAFLKVVSLGLNFLWEYIPSVANIPLYTIIICIIGGVAIGLCQKKFGNYPDSLEDVLQKVKSEHRYSYDKIIPMLICATLPLVFGASVGPEAGLTGVIVGLCYWAGDQFSYAGKNIKNLTEIGVAATLGTIFFSPFLGLVAPYENEALSNKENIFPKTTKILFNLIAILSAIGAYYILNSNFGGGLSFPRFAAATIGKNELIYFIPIAAIGIVFGLLYVVINKLVVVALKPLKNSPIIKAIGCGIIFAIVGMMIPLTMFSGESQIEILIEHYAEYTAVALIVIAVVKLFTTSLCINSGWKGGMFFPAIFAGVALGFALALLLPIDPVFSVMVLTASEIGLITRKPVLTALILLLCFPMSGIVILLAAAAIASIIPIPQLKAKLKKAE